MQSEVKVILIDGTNYLAPVDNIESIKRMHAGKIKSIKPVGSAEMITSNDVEITTSRGKKKVTN